MSGYSLMRFRGAHFPRTRQGPIPELNQGRNGSDRIDPGDCPTGPFHMVEWTDIGDAGPLTRCQMTPRCFPMRRGLPSLCCKRPTGRPS